jgi:hypothetical protein
MNGSKTRSSYAPTGNAINKILAGSVWFNASHYNSYFPIAS